MYSKRRRHIKKLGKKEQHTKNEQESNHTTETDSRYLCRDLETNLEKIEKTFGNSSDLIVRRFVLGGSKLNAVAVYLNGIIDHKMVSRFVNTALNGTDNPKNQDKLSQNAFDFINGNASAIENVKSVKEWNRLFLAVLSGYTVLLIDGWNEAIAGNTEGGKQRSVMEPTAQLVVRGPRDSFTESIGTNAALVRRRIKSPALWIESMNIGSVTHTDVAIMYIKGIAKDSIVKEVKERLKNIETDRILESGYIEEYIQDNSFTPFPTVYNTERPDAVAGNLLEGKVAVFIDGTPFVLIVPVTFMQFFQSPSDYYQRTDIGSFLRMLRFVTFTLSLLTPSVYIALITFHQEMIPTTLLISLTAQHEGVPFPAFIEALLMELTFEILREAGIRMPRAVGQAVSIAGALVIGEAAVQAGIVSPAMVIVVALTGIASFAVPSYNIAVSARLLRFMMMVLAASFGLYGVVLGLIVMIAHMNSLRSFGIPYLKPFAPFVLSDMKDAFARAPLWTMKTRPEMISQDVTKKPSPSRNDMSGNEGESDET